MPREGHAGQVGVPAGMLQVPVWSEQGGGLPPAPSKAGVSAKHQEAGAERDQGELHAREGAEQRSDKLLIFTFFLI